MRTCLFLWIFLQIFDLSASQEFHYIERLEGESVDISCNAQQSKSQPYRLYLRRRTASEKLLTISEGKRVTPDPEIEGRIKISGQLNLHTVNVTLSDLRHTDTGLYVCEFFSEHPHDQLSVNTNLLLLVRAAGELGSCGRQSVVIYTISVGVCLLLAGIFFFAVYYKKASKFDLQEPKTIPIYEDMSGYTNSAQRHACAQDILMDV